MPELPEVQTVIDTLASQIKGLKINDVNIIYKPIVETSEKEFKKAVIGQHFNAFKRRGKYLLFELDDITLVSHLRMEGKYYILTDKDPIDKHTHVIFKLSNGKELRYHDVRKFGRMELMPKDDDYLEFKDLGPEPFSKYFNYSYCKEYLKDKKLPIKQVLLRQDFVAGVGNIYADEILYAIKVNPCKLALNLSKNEILSLIKETKRILKEAIKAGGTTIRSYTSSLGVTGRFQQSLKCHTIEKCCICGSNIIKTTVATRGTYYCPTCQKLSTKIAITGTIGSGKSEVANYLKEKGYYVFDCDETNKKLLKKGNIGYNKVKKQFPDAFNNEKLNRKKLAKIIFNDKKAKLKLESIMHPLIIEEMEKESNKHELFFAEVPLLYEIGLEEAFDRVLVVSSNDEISIQRLKKRGLNENEALERIKSQMSTKDKIARADDVIYNNSTMSKLHSNVDKWLRSIC